MSRQLYRVPLDFDWPLKKVWTGFINPHWRPCPEDNRTCFAGYSPAGKWLGAVCDLLGLLGEEAQAAPHADALRARGRLYPHPYLEEWGQAPRLEIPRSVRKRLDAIGEQVEHRAAWLAELRRPRPLVPLTSELQAFVEGLLGRPLRGFEGCMGAYEIRQKLIAAAGVDPATWGVCSVCSGSGTDPERAAYDAWEPTLPPKGEGWQLWETVSEGSPISPVLPTREAFVAYLIGQGYSEDAAENFTAGGWAPSGMMVDGVMMRDIESLGQGGIHGSA